MKKNEKINFVEKIVDYFIRILDIVIIFSILGLIVGISGFFIKLPSWIDKNLYGVLITILMTAFVFGLFFIGIPFSYILAFLFIFISFKIRMPYYHWVENNFPSWLALIVFLIFGISMVLIAFPKKNNKKINSILFILFLMSSIFVAPCLNIGPPIKSLILFLSFILFCILSLKHNRKKSREKKSKTPTV